MIHLPVSYSIRNLRRRPWRSAATVAGIAIIVFASGFMLSLNRGLHSRIHSTGEEQNILVISRAGQNIMFSSISEDEIVQLSSLAGVAQDSYGGALVSPEIMHMSMVECSDNGRTVSSSVYMRGVMPVAYEVHKVVRIAEGALPEEQGQILVGNTAHVKLGVSKEALAPGKTVRFEGKDWTVAGRFTAGGSLIESEMWIDVNILKQLLRRQTCTFAVVRMANAGAVSAAMPAFSATGAVERYFKGWPEKDYYQEFGNALSWLFWLSILMVVIITSAGALIGANTMYTAVLNRMKEIATHRVLGFGKVDILSSLLSESVVLSAIGGLAGISATLLVNGLPLKLSYGAFYLVVDWTVYSVGLGLALFIGLVGGLFPVLKGLRMTVVEGLKYG
jgi:putative ABC transport system permease protein